MPALEPHTKGSWTASFATAWGHYIRIAGAASRQILVDELADDRIEFHSEDYFGRPTDAVTPAS